MNIGIIMAGGTGNRMTAETRETQALAQGAAQTAPQQAALPKQFITLGDKPIIMHTLSTFLESCCFDAVYIGMHPDWVEYMGDALVNRSTPILPAGLHIISGGEDRNSTLLNVLDAIESDLRDLISSDTAFDGSDNPQIDEYDPIIVTHDAVRPFVTPEMIKNSIDSARLFGVATVAIPTTDTIAAVNSTEAVSSILDRSTLLNIQTPQSFRLSAFREAYSSLSKEQIASLTDVCGVFTSSGKSVAVVSGAPSNIKITTPMDLKIADLLLK